MPARPTLAIAVLLLAGCTTGAPGRPGRRRGRTAERPPAATRPPPPGHDARGLARVGARHHRRGPAGRDARRRGRGPGHRPARHVHLGRRPGRTRRGCRARRSRVGQGEPLTVRLEPPTPLDAWAARVVPSTATDPSGATSLGAGIGTPAFAAPAAGSWTVEVAADVRRRRRTGELLLAARGQPVTGRTWRPRDRRTVARSIRVVVVRPAIRRSRRPVSGRRSRSGRPRAASRQGPSGA